jgi:hypothetical protein
MPRYFFNVRDANGFRKDDEGQDFPNLEAAHVEALKTAEQLWIGMPPDVARAGMAFEISDESGTMLETVPFVEAGERLLNGTGDFQSKQ